ncbi:MAG: hypothetical protein H6Q05_1270 [Acidobacteria bacterium]|nr:hypothetical protein [Acidobacteriota bacterium]
MNMKVHVRKPTSIQLFSLGFSVLALVLFSGSTHPLAAQSAPAAAGTTAANGSSGGSTATGDRDKTAQAPVSFQPAAKETVKVGAYEVHSEFEVGYRMSPGVDGNSQMYRSQVNLFEGVRLLGSSLSLRSAPGTGLFDRMDLSLSNWGDPYNGLRVRIGRMDAYDLQASYRNLNYYNYISTFANPLLEQGNSFAQHNLNVDYRMSDVTLRLFPNRKIVPFVGYSRNSASGPGFTTVSSTANEFLLETRWENTSDEFRGGLQFDFPKFNLTLEQGYRHQKNDTSVVDAGFPAGNQPGRTFFGQTITQDDLNRSYHGRISLPVSKVLAKITPIENLRMTGRYIYTMGKVDSDLSEIRTGNLVTLEDFLAYSTAADSFNGRAKKPNHNGSFLVEYSPVSRLTVTDIVDTIDYHISGTAMLQTLYTGARSLLGPGPETSVTVNRLLNTEFAYNQLRNQAEAQLDLGMGFAVRIGHRYAQVDVSSEDSEETLSSYSTQHTALAGLTYRPGSWLRVGFDYENTSTDRALTRTDLYNYDRINLDLRMGSWKGFSLNGRLSLRNNTNPAPDIDLNSHDRNYIVGLSYEASDRISVSADYSRMDLFSDLLFVIPQNFRTDRSIFDERVSGFGGRMGIGIYRGSKVEMGYRGIISRGTAPIELHQPFLSILVPLGGGMAFKPTWQYYGYSDTLFNQQNFKTHLVTFALVYSR